MKKDAVISLKKVCVHNLKSVSLEIPQHQLVVLSGVSGSGKSSLAFDTLYTEGQRRYVTSLSSFARKFLGDLSKPDMESADGISPTVAIEQKTIGRNPRSTVGTITEIHDYLRVLFARLAIPYCPVSGQAVQPQTLEQIVEAIQQLKKDQKIIILSPLLQQKKSSLKEEITDLRKKGFTKIRLDGQIVDLGQDLDIDPSQTHNLDVVIDRLSIHPQYSTRINEATTLALEMSKGSCLVLTFPQEEELFFSTHAFSPASGISYPPLQPHDFSFNHPLGMCSYCEGLGKATTFNLNAIIDPDKSIEEDCCVVATSYQTIRYKNIYDNLGRLFHFKTSTPWKKLPEEAKNIFLYGDKQRLKMIFKHPLKPLQWVDYLVWEGVIPEALKRYREAKSEKGKEKYRVYLTEQLCPQCQGSKIKPYPSAARFAEKTLQQISALTIDELSSFFKQIQPQDDMKDVIAEFTKEILQRLQFLIDVGLDYLTLDRSGATLSGGEAQRVRLAAQIGCGLVGVTYILDEPSIGLHHQDNEKLILTLKKLRDKGNNVIVVEHDEDTILEADHVIDFGPGAGLRGGSIVYQGDVNGLLQHPSSLTGLYLSKRNLISNRKPSKLSSSYLKIEKASHNNLKNISVKIPLESLVVFSGVSGSGKSSLVTETLFPFLSNQLMGSHLPVGKCKTITIKGTLHKIIGIDQSPIGKNPRSTPATYIKLWDEIRQLFAQIPLSLSKGYQAGRFSFNVEEGSCLKCHGMGGIKIDMDFLDDVFVECDHCFGKRFDTETLTVHYKGKNIHDILQMTVDEALLFFENHPKIESKLRTLCLVGLDYMKLGQSSTTLSGGEAQRIKLAKELVRPAHEKTLYILDEPSVGLHAHDISLLLNVLYQLKDAGHSIIMIEHNLDLIAHCDWVIDIGPQGGYRGGCIMAEGTPKTIAKQDCPTGKSLQHFFDNKKLISHRKKTYSAIDSIELQNLQENNLKNISLSIPREQLIGICGPSGSGKSSLAFDTIYAEGQRRYTETLSPYARQFVKQMPKPKFEDISGLSPCIAIEQKANAGNPRSTIGTMTEIYDYLRLLYARLGIPHCPETKEVIQAVSKDIVAATIMSFPFEEKLHILAPLHFRTKDLFEEAKEKFYNQGFLRLYLNGTHYELSDPIPFSSKKKNHCYLVIDRLKNSPSVKERLLEAITQATRLSDQKVAVLRENNTIQEFNLKFCVPSTGKTYPEITAHTFSFNVPEGMCSECQGLGTIQSIFFPKEFNLEEISIRSFLHYIFGSSAFQQTPLDQWWLEQFHIDLNAPISTMTPQQQHVFLYGSEQNYTLPNCTFQWRGIYPFLALAAQQGHYHIKDILTPLLKNITCPSCLGDRLNPLARHVTIQNHSLPQICEWNLSDLQTFITSLTLSKEQQILLDETYKQIVLRINFLCSMGLGYLSLNRTAPTLSGGETQRIRLARQLGSGLTGIIYILDEPSMGLHPQDAQILLEALKNLKQQGNSLICVEHDPLILKECDHLFELGPQSGAKGGTIIAQGIKKKFLQNKQSITAPYLTKKTQTVTLKQIPSKNLGWIHVKNVFCHNLENFSVSIPLGHITSITGVCGSGKSTLLKYILKEGLDTLAKTPHEHSLPCFEGSLNIESESFTYYDLVVLDQQPIGRTSRSDVATYVDLLTPLREWFALLPEAKVKGLMPGNFSYNHKKGMCLTCYGLGYKKIQLHFLPDTHVTCQQCQGLRLNSLSNSVTYHDKSLGQYLQLTVEALHASFQHIPKIHRLCNVLKSLGLGYLHLNQEVATLSNGEAQRLRLAEKLSKRNPRPTIYLLDEPSSGLHFQDLNLMMPIFESLRNLGHTLIIVEHNLDVIKNSDYIIELGPKAGKEGGKLLYSGPKNLFTQSLTPTSQFLNQHLS